jgi:hypothetical protein
MRVIGFDCGIKALGVSIIDFNISDAKKKIVIIEEKWKKTRKALQMLEEMNELLNNMIKIVYVNVFDLLPSQKVEETTSDLRSSRLKAVLLQLDRFRPFDEVIIEYQMCPGDKNREIHSKIEYHFASPDNKYCSCLSKKSDEDEEKKELCNRQKIITVKPSLKQKIAIGENGKYSNFIQKYSSNYTANKAHSRYNFLEWIELFGCDVDVCKIKKSKLKDVADATLMVLAHVFNS